MRPHLPGLLRRCGIESRDDRENPTQSGHALVECGDSGLLGGAVGEFHEHDRREHTRGKVKFQTIARCCVFPPPAEVAGKDVRVGQVGHERWSGKSGAEPRKARRARKRRASATGSVTRNPVAVGVRATFFALRRNECGNRSACELPDLKTFAVVGMYLRCNTTVGRARANPRCCGGHGGLRARQRREKMNGEDALIFSRDVRGGTKVTAQESGNSK